MKRKWMNTFLPVCITLSAFSLPVHAGGDGAGIVVEKLLETETSWDGIRYAGYPQGTPQLSVLKITIPPFTAIPWHQHAVPNAGYIMSGSLTVEKKADGAVRILHAGEVLPEMVNAVHRGFTRQEGAVILVFYAGQKGIPLSLPAK